VHAGRTSLKRTDTAFILSSVDAVAHAISNRKECPMNCRVNAPLPDSDTTIDDHQFRSIMRSMVAGVTLITTSHEGRVHGMTATAFSSVSADPPTILIVLNRSTRTHPLVSASKHFVVTLLAEDQIELSKRFSGKLDNQFDGISYTLNEHGVPVIDGAVASMECATITEMNVGTHTIFIARVLKGNRSQTSPLVYHDGSYKVVARHEVA
jgi:flavin reductase